ncbi:MAG: hypothetical protein HY779_04110 [Rubrobacteridae bacterium]|nr:hypothetical protein [Rubrobacteridae bacterium]
MVTRILNSAIDFGADIVVAACPLCQSNLAERQSLMQQKFGLKKAIPVVYFTQLLGLALGIDNKKLDLSADVLTMVKKRQAEKVSEIASEKATEKASKKAGDK